MKKLLLVGLISFSIASKAQTRFCQEIFQVVKITDSIVYSTNRIYFPYTTGIPPIGNLSLDLYEPQGDTSLYRPLVIVLHGGNFLPQPYNLSVFGSRHDSDVVELCKRFARHGFVAAAISYRVGWNAISDDQDTRTSSLLKAVYRALQDTKGAVRFFKKDAASTNQYKIDPTKITVIGNGSGGFVSMAYSSLNRYEEITLPKFLDGINALPYVDTNIMGNFDGFGGNQNYNLPNWPGYDSKINMAINLGGSLGDSSWIEPGEVPILCFQVAGDPYAPYYQGMVIVPTTGGNVVYVTGSHDIIKLCNNPAYGDNNAIFKTPAFTDAITQSINHRNDGLEGLCPFFTIPQQQSGPWEWWDNNTAVAMWGQDVVTDELITSPNMSKPLAMAYLDTIIGYSIPRMVRVMGLSDCPGTTAIGENNVTNKIQISPNPAKDFVNVQISNNQNPINKIQILDLRGHIVWKSDDLKGNQEIIDLKNLASGLYHLQVQTTTIFGKVKLVIE
jgi:hypothetical protein